MLVNTSVNCNIVRDKDFSLHLLDIYYVLGTVHKNKTPDSQVHNLVWKTYSVEEIKCTHTHRENVQEYK